MITIGYCTQELDENYNKHIIKTCGLDKKKIHIITIINKGDRSLSECYNQILNESNTDITILCHNDLIMETKQWGKKLIKHFEKGEYGILGMAGTTYMPKSGMWWEDRKKMVGIVNHEHEGKKWESKYSESLGNSVLETVIIDGLFIAIDRRKLKTKFNEDFKGFHFYDIPFCFENHLAGVKIGVITNIRITHKSIGVTNEQWEENRKLFESKYKDNLPVKLPFDTKRKIKVLIGCLFFRTFTGSELYVYELAKSLMKLNCSVTVVSQIGGPLTDMAKKIGIKCVSFENAPGFKLGDGKWGMNTTEGFKVSILNSLYRVSETDFDIVHFQHKPVGERILNMYPELPKIAAIHSEVISLEDPVKDDTIKKYIAIRPEIKEHMINNFEIPEEMIEVIYNPVDNEKFKPKDVSEKNYVLFVGTMDYLRKETILDLIEYTREIGKELWLVGENNGNYLDNLLIEEHVKHFPSTWNVEDFISKSYETAGIQLGRTTIESWMCGKSSWIYKVDSGGFILSKEKYDPPTDIEKYYTMNVAQQIKDEYLKLI